MDEVMKIESMDLQEIRRKWPHYTLDTFLDDLRGLSEVLERIEDRSGIAIYGRFYAGRDIVRMIERSKL